MQPAHAQPRNSTFNQVMNGFSDALGYHFMIEFLDNPRMYPLYRSGAMLNGAIVFFPEAIKMVGVARLCIFGGCLALHLRHRVPLQPRFYAFLATHIVRGMTEIHGSLAFAKFWFFMDLVNTVPRAFDLSTRVRRF